MQSRDSQRWKESEMSEMSIRGVFDGALVAVTGAYRVRRSSSTDAVVRPDFQRPRHLCASLQKYQTDFILYMHC